MMRKSNAKRRNKLICTEEEEKALKECVAKYAKLPRKSEQRSVIIQETLDVLGKLKNVNNEWNRYRLGNYVRNRVRVNPRKKSADEKEKEKEEEDHDSEDSSEFEKIKGKIKDLERSLEHLNHKKQILQQNIDHMKICNENLRKALRSLEEKYGELGPEDEMEDEKNGGDE